MQNLKNIAVGFLVSFIGSIPLGYLNIVGYEIYNKSGIISTSLYLLGVICVEFLVIFGTLFFADKLNKNEKLLKTIELFSILFMFVLAYVFYTNGDDEQTNKTIFSTVSQNFFFSGILFSSLNFIQIPFWLSWNLYLVNRDYIEISKNRKYFYVFGTLVGTFLGMLILILSLYCFANQVDFLSIYLMKIIIPLVFILLGILQTVKFYKKFK